MFLGLLHLSETWIRDLQNTDRHQREFFIKPWFCNIDMEGEDLLLRSDVSFYSRKIPFSWRKWCVCAIIIFNMRSCRLQRQLVSFRGWLSGEVKPQREQRLQSRPSTRGRRFDVKMSCEAAFSSEFMCLRWISSTQSFPRLYFYLCPTSQADPVWRSRLGVWDQPSWLLLQKPSASWAPTWGIQTYHRTSGEKTNDHIVKTSIVNVVTRRRHEKKMKLRLVCPHNQLASLVENPLIYSGGCERMTVPPANAPKLTDTV